MTKTPDDTRRQDPKPGPDDNGKPDSPASDPRATSHPVGADQAAENAENEPAG
jgi:hypothetical protein